MFRKLSSKIIVFAVTLSITITLVLSSIAIIQINKSITENSAAQLKSVALYSASGMDKVLFSVQGKVDSVAYTIVKNVDGQKLLEKDMNYFKQFETNMNEQAIDQLGSLEGVVSAYIRYDPKLTYGTSGLFYTDSDGKGNKEKVQPTDLLAYSKDDKEHVGWFYEPLAIGEASWMEPYYNANQERTIISYVAPFYIEGKDFGVVGVDFDFDYITQINNMNDVYDTGYTFMLGKNYNFISHPEYVNGEDGSLAVVKEKMKANPNGFIDIGRGKNNIIMGYATLSNGWVVGICPTSQEVYASRTSTMLLLLVAAIILIIISCAVAYIMGKIMTRYIPNLVQSINSITNGDFTVQINADGMDEISDVSKRLYNFVERMKEVIVELATTCYKLEQQSAESTNISGVMYDLIGGQTQSTEKLKLFVNNLVQATEDIASNATSLANAVSEVSTQAGNAKHKMSEMVTLSEKGSDCMISIRDSVEGMSTLINDLDGVVTEFGASANEINKITKVIEDIASQTNLLSLNASIEAARAGDAGKGFAIVASEIGKLACMCTSAAKQITDLTNRVNLQVENTVSKTQYAVNDVKESKVLVENIYNTFMDIYGCVQKTDSLLDDVTNSIKSVDGVASSMAAITEEQSASTEEMHTVSDEVYNHSLKTGEASKGVTKVAEELKTTTIKIKNISQFFKI